MHRNEVIFKYFQQGATRELNGDNKFWTKARQNKPGPNRPNLIMFKLYITFTSSVIRAQINN